MFQGLRGRLLLSYLIVMEAILILFSGGIYFLFSRSLARQLDIQLKSLADVVAPSFQKVHAQGNQYFNQLDNPPWGHLFDPKHQSIEWFDARKQLLARQGTLPIAFSPEPGFWTLPPTGISEISSIRTVTLSVWVDRSSLNLSSVEGYVRISQSLENLEKLQRQLLGQLAVFIVSTLGLVTLTGWWLTQRAITPVEQSFQQMKQFTADASHELRGPLTVIKASVDIICNHPERIHAKDIKKLSAIASATQQMTHLVHDLLFLARTDADITLPDGEWGAIVLDALLQDVVDWLEPLAQAKQIELRYVEPIPVKVIGDRTQLSRLFANLLENALKYTPAGGQVVLSLSKHHRHVFVSVEDTGIGIVAEDLPLVFDRFWRADKARSRQEGGTGLGLSIATAITARHRGKITVSSQIGQGSCFEVCLPLHGDG